MTLIIYITSDRIKVYIYDQVFFFIPVERKHLIYKKKKTLQYLGLYFIFHLLSLINQFLSLINNFWVGLLDTFLSIG
jgi:hypothetical protein